MKLKPHSSWSVIFILSMWCTNISRSENVSLGGLDAAEVGAAAAALARVGGLEVFLVLIS